MQRSRQQETPTAAKDERVRRFMDVQMRGECMVVGVYQFVIGWGGGQV